MVDSDKDGLSDDYEKGVGRYQIVQGDFNWLQAKEGAALRGGHLATIINQKELEAVQGLVSEPNGKMWLGAAHEGKGMLWITGEPWDNEMAQSLWRIEEPDGIGQGLITGSVTFEDKDMVTFSAFLLLEEGYFTDPNNSDTDGDGLSDGDEVNLYQTVPTNSDTDWDTFSDKEEIEIGSDPNDQSSFPNTDSDGDGLSDAYEIGLSRYEFIRSNLTWHEAKSDAEQRGGHLLTITSQEEWEAVLHLLQLNQPAWAVPIWAGGTDQEEEGNWKWITGEPWEFSAWSEGEPNNLSGEHFLTIEYRGWNDLPADDDTFETAYILEHGYFTDPHNPDTDGDGANDRVEMETGSVPTNPNSFPSLLTVSLTRDNAPLLELRGDGTGIWIIERSTDMKTWKSWKALQMPENTEVFLDEDSSDETTIFYRAVKQ